MPEAELHALLASAPTLRLTAIHCPGDYVVAGPTGAMPKGKGQPIDYDLVVHCPEFKPFEKKWHKLHSRETTPVPDVRFYTHATNTHYQPAREKIADALTNQALHTLDFPAVIERAYAEVHRITKELAASGHIVYHEHAGCWTLPAGLVMEEREGAPARLRVGTVVPKQFRHLVK